MVGDLRDLLTDHGLALFDPQPQVIYQGSHACVLKDNEFECSDALLILLPVLVDGRHSLGIGRLLGYHWLQQACNQLSHARLEVQPLDLLRLDYM